MRALLHMLMDKNVMFLFRLTNQHTVHEFLCIAFKQGIFQLFVGVSFLIAVACGILRLDVGAITIVPHLTFDGGYVARLFVFGGAVFLLYQLEDIEFLAAFQAFFLADIGNDLIAFDMQRRHRLEDIIFLLQFSHRSIRGPHRGPFDQPAVMIVVEGYLRVAGA